MLTRNQDSMLQHTNKQIFNLNYIITITIIINPIFRNVWLAQGK